jgi:FkbM family methyltransferase
VAGTLDLLRRRPKEVGWSTLLRNFGLGDLSYLLGHRSAVRPIVEGSRTTFSPEEKFLFVSLRNAVIMLRNRGFTIRGNDAAVEVENFPFLPDGLHLPVPPFSARELRNLFLLLRHGLTYGACVDPQQADHRPKSMEIDVPDRTVRVNHTVRFYLDLLDAWTLTETYFLGIHRFAPLAGRTVLDVGAEFGDSALYFASEGATVTAVEPASLNYAALERHLALNGEIGNRVHPVHAAVGPTGRLRLYTTSGVVQGGASAFPSPGARVDSRAVEEVDSFSVADLLDHVGWAGVDILKMDGKGCEYLLGPRDLERVREAVAVEYGDATPDRLRGLLDQLRMTGFDTVLALQNPETSGILARHGTIYAYRRPAPPGVPARAPH